MRDILFKGKREYGEWVEGYAIHEKESGKYGILTGELYDSNENERLIVFEVDPETICQYIGLKDKTGKRIFEGDIVEGWFNHEKVRGRIFYGSDATFFIQRKGLYGIVLNNAEDWVEVIGNVFDDPVEG